MGDNDRYMKMMKEGHQLQHPEYEYLNLCRNVLKQGNEKGDRTGTGTMSVFGYQMRFDLQKGFPLLTTKKIPFHLIASELLWFIKGDTNIRYLLKHNNNIWNEWAFKNWVERMNIQDPDMNDFGCAVKRMKSSACNMRKRWRHLSKRV